MQAYWTLVRRELGSQFFSWIGYVIIAVVTFLIGLSFYTLLDTLNNDATPTPITELFYNTMYFWAILVLVAPVITMRSFAQEKATGTFETLMTTPVSDAQVVLAKFSAAQLFYMLMWLPLLACLLIVRHYSSDPTAFDAGTTAASFLGIFLIGAPYMALGCFASSLTRSQIIAAMISFAASFSFFIVSFLSMNFASQTGWKAQLFTQIGMVEHMRDFARGVVDTRPVVFYLSLTGMFLFLTLKVVESRRWK